jgi:hypothetical protein
MAKININIKGNIESHDVDVSSTCFETSPLGHKSFEIRLKEGSIRFSENEMLFLIDAFHNYKDDFDEDDDFHEDEDDDYYEEEDEEELRRE